MGARASCLSPQPCGTRMTAKRTRHLVPRATWCRSLPSHRIRRRNGPRLCGGPAFFAYADNYLIDVSFGVIVDVEASRAVRQAEVATARTMLERTERLELVNLTALGAQPRTKKDEQIVPKARSEYRQRVTPIATARLSRCLRWEGPTYY